MRKFLSYLPISLDLGLLILRAGAGLALVTHGWPKLQNFGERASKFADPFGLGPEISLGLVVFAEFFCSLLVVLGVYTRLALIPLIINMATIVFLIHGGDPFGKKELAVLFLVSFGCLFFTGPGKYSVDGFRK
jgi:Predicted membrane protein